MENTKKVPVLRFSEFSGEWEVKALEKLTENGFSNGVFNDPNKVGKGYKLINVKDMYTEGSINIDKLALVDIDEKEFFKNKVEYGDIFFTRSSLVKEGIAYSNVNFSHDENLTYDGHLIRMRPFKKTIDPYFLCTVFKTSFARKQFIEGGKTTTMTTIGQDDVAKVKVFFPSILEQQKIADFLSQIDNRIEKLTKKKQLLESYKKGVMQKIFNQELRFKNDDGLGFPEWEVKNLGKVFNNYGGTSLEEFAGFEGHHHFISIGNYEKNGIYFDNKQRIILNDKTKLRLLDKNNLVMVLNDKTSSGDLIGATILISEDNKYIYNQRSERLVCTEIIKPKYAWHFLNSYKFRKEIFSISQGGTQIYVNFPAVKKLVIPLPILEEQTKIANFLTEIDDKINLVSKQLEGTKQYKQGLLQKMFV